VWSKVWVCGRSLAGIAGSNPAVGGGGCLSLVNIVCYQVEVSASGWSLVQRNPTECDVCQSMIEEPHKGVLGPLGLSSRKKKQHKNVTVATISRVGISLNLKGEKWISGKVELPLTVHFEAVLRKVGSSFCYTFTDRSSDGVRYVHEQKGIVRRSCFPVKRDIIHRILQCRRTVIGEYLVDVSLPRSHGVRPLETTTTVI
jgi:hypothetical protein